MHKKENYNSIIIFVLIIVFNLNKIIGSVDGVDDTVMENKNGEVIFEANTENGNKFKGDKHPTTISEVIFIPNERINDNDYLENQPATGGVHLVNILEGEQNPGKSIHDILYKDKEVRVETESPTRDIIFYDGKNKEPEDRDDKDKSYMAPKKEKGSSTKLDCQNLICNRTFNATCGAKQDNHIWKYRSFMNECYFRKVNCHFKYPENRYIEVDNSNCKGISRDNLKTYQDFRPFRNDKKQGPHVDTKRSLGFRRSLNIQINGVSCSHNCPVTCTETYAPECAISENGLKKVFINHCKLDFTSCSENNAWRRLPMAECIGRKKAEFKENRAFIGWMQKTGIIDGRGRLAIA